MGVGIRLRRRIDKSFAHRPGGELTLGRCGARIEVTNKVLSLTTFYLCRATLRNKQLALALAIFTARRYLLARYMLWPCLSLSVRHESEFY